MYNCRLHIYLAGHSCRAFEVIREMCPLEHFTHIFSESDRPEKSLASEADVIIADLSGMDSGADLKSALRILIQNRNSQAQIILLADQDQTRLLTGGPVSAGNTAAPGAHESDTTDLSGVHDIWISPMTDDEIRFRFSRWQQAYKMGKDYWQTSQYLEATIDHIPNLVWYKDKNGLHEKVNDSFCRAVNKTKQQVEGRGHAYIWDVDQDDPACIESEQEVMNRKQTCVSEEVIKAGDSMRTLTTYKSPLYDLDGSVMVLLPIFSDLKLI